MVLLGWIEGSQILRMCGLLCLYALECRQTQKKRRILWTVVSLYQPLFQRLMLLDYQMELNFASGLLSRECWLEENVVEKNG